MNKTLLFGAGGIVSLIALGIVFSNDSVEVHSETALQVENNQATVPPSAQEHDIEVDYTASEKTVTTQKETAATGAKHLTLEPFMEAKTVDRSGTFEITLINAQKDASKATGAYRALQGTIDGEPFTLKVPQHLIDEGVGVTELHIKNRKTGETSSVAAVFIEDMRNPAMKQSIEVDSKNLQNFQQQSTEAIAPLLPGEQRE